LTLALCACGGGGGPSESGSGSGGAAGGSGSGGAGGAAGSGAAGTAGSGEGGGGAAGGTAGIGGSGGGTTGAGGSGGVAGGAGGRAGSGGGNAGGAGSGGGGGGNTGAGGLAGGAGGRAGSAGGTAGAGGRAGSGGATAGAGGRAGSGGASGAVKIMAIGDSITRATCWRDFLWQDLQPSFAGHFDLVGTLNADYGCGVTGFDADNQGYSSSLVTEVVAGVTNARTCDPFCPALSDLRTAFNATRPDVVLMHWGTNDVWNGRPTASITSAFGSVIDAVRAANPAVTILLAQIIPMNVTSATCAGCSCAGCSTAVPALNAAITSFAAGKSTAASPVLVVDQYTGFSATADTRDGVHPNTSGSQKMASNWYQALTANQLVR
jgi:lysophospholipase L1-like esterase